jgi:hypothetical protein
MAIPKARVTFGATVTDGLIEASVTKEENMYDTAQLKFSNQPALYPTPIDKGETVLIEVQDGAVGGAWTTLFSGTVLFCDFSFGSSTEILVQCVGLGYALNMMNVAEEYGTQSRNPTVYSTKTILNDANKGILTKWVNKYAGGTNDSGYSLTDTYIEGISGAIEYLSFPWKPANKCLDDICDLNTALTANTSIGHTGVGAGSTTAITVAGWYEECIGSYVTFTSGVNNGLSRLVTGWSYAGGPVQTTFTCDAFPNAYAALDTFDIWTTSGPHWIVDNSGNLRVKRINAGQTGWTHYFGGSTATATLVAGVDFFDGDFQSIAKEANIIVYNGTWRRPSNGDSWTDTDSATGTWAKHASTTLFDLDTDRCVGEFSLKAYLTPPDVAHNWMSYPSDRDAGWDFSGFTEFNTPSLNFYFKIDGLAWPTAATIYVYLFQNSTDTPEGGFTIPYWRADLSGLVQENLRWYHFSIPIGPYYNQKDKNDGDRFVAVGGAPTWNPIDNLMFYTHGGYDFWVDGVYFGNAPICRIARQTLPTEGMPIGTLGTTANPMRFKVITDDVGKDDSLVALDDSGLIAQYAKSELMKLNSTPTLGKFTTPMIPTWLPGQFAYISSTDYRSTKLTHTINNRGFTTSFEVTTDVTNSHSRRRFEDMNKIYAAIRPEYQDRQASSIKSGTMDIRIVPLEKAYNI